MLFHRTLVKLVPSYKFFMLVANRVHHKLPSSPMATPKTHCSVDIERRVVNTRGASVMENWTLDIESRVRDDNLSSEEQPWKNVSIYKVPAFAASLNRKAFTPQLVSFGPYHHENEDLKLMEVHKERALVHFIRNARKPLGEFVASVECKLKALQDSYYRLDEKWRVDKDAFLKLMITDGCFMLEILRFAKGYGTSYSDTDPIFSQHGIQHMMHYIRRDMLLIENQLPLLLLKTLVAGKAPETNEVSECIDDRIRDLVLNFFYESDTPEQKSGEKMSPRHHALDLYRQSLLCPVASNRTKEPKPKGGGTGAGTAAMGVIRCAVELRESGVRFRNNGKKRLNDIRFCPHRGILYLPELLVDDSTECMLLNMVAFEHLHAAANHDISHYVCFMDEIINSAQDVSLLHSKGIIKNSLGSDEAVAGVFNQISRELTVDQGSPLVEVRRQVHEYCQKRWKKWCANLRHTYFRNPWSALSLAGALLLIGFAVMQTVYAILDYYKP